MAKLGLPTRVSGLRDRRSTLVGLTGNGKAVIGRAMGTHMRCEQAMIAALPAAERQALAALLAKLLPAIEAEHRKGQDE